MFAVSLNSAELTTVSDRVGAMGAKNCPRLFIRLFLVAKVGLLAFMWLLTGAICAGRLLRFF